MKSNRLKYVMLCLFVLFCAVVAEGPLKLNIEQITFGNKHHLFGYIGHCMTIPWNKSGRYILTIESDFHDHLPKADDIGSIAIIDTENEYKLEILDTTRAWNLQQGTMFYWNPEAPETQFFFNDRDENNKVFTVLYDIEKGKRIKEYKFEDTPVANNGVCPAGGFFYAINYARMARLRPVTGYPDAWDWTKGKQAPDNDGIWKVDIASGEKKLLVSFKKLASDLGEKSAELYINHTLSNRKGSRVYFFARGKDEGNEMHVSQPYVMNSDGTGLKKTKDIGGHPEWLDETRVIGKGSDSEMMIYDVVKDKRVGSIGPSKLFADQKGDIALSPNREMFVNGWERDGKLNYHIYRMTDGKHVETEPRNQGPYIGGKLRIDGAPRWNRTGDKILIPGWVGGDKGTRQLHIISVEGAAVNLKDEKATLNKLQHSRFSIRNGQILGFGNVQCSIYDFRGRKNQLFKGEVKGVASLDFTRYSTGVYLYEIVDVQSGLVTSGKIEIP